MTSPRDHIRHIFCGAFPIRSPDRVPLDVPDVNDEHIEMDVVARFTELRASTVLGGDIDGNGSEAVSWT